MLYPTIIQGGMGVGVSNYRLARAVSKAGQLGVVSGTMLDTVLARRLQDGDLDGLMRRAIYSFPVKEISDRVLNDYYIEGGKSPDAPYKAVPMHTMCSSDALISLTILANYVEVFLAKDGHDGIVGINYLTKIELPTLPSIFGAMLAGVDYILMGAGIPRAIPGILDLLSEKKPVSMRIDVEGSKPDDNFTVNFDPGKFEIPSPTLKRPRFLAIVSSSVLAQSLAKKSSGTVDGFVVEHHCAGGHNAPPRGGITTDANGEPIYGPKDEIDTESFRRLGLPFWLAGGYGSPEGLKLALQAGARGIQAGTLFAFCNESGITTSIKKKVVELVKNGSAEVFTDPLASASSYPFKVVPVDTSLSEQEIYLSRDRICDLGYLRQAYKKEDGNVGFRCPGEPVDAFVRKGGLEVSTCGRKCLCNGLMSTVGLEQVRSSGYVEPPLVTAGKYLPEIARIVSEFKDSYSAEDVLRFLFNQVKQQQNKQALLI
ncbi:MAG: nitronate monooxygenase [Candidatus Melainabacteria bacterium]|nr:nitronate monooxygenase [Candidatus Melainabacteria bacterium]